MFKKFFCANSALFSSNQQQDAFEFLQYTLDEINKRNRALSSGADVDQGNLLSNVVSQFQFTFAV